MTINPSQKRPNLSTKHDESVVNCGHVLFNNTYVCFNYVSSMHIYNALKYTNKEQANYILYNIYMLVLMFLVHEL